MAIALGNKEKRSRQRRIRRRRHGGGRKWRTLLLLGLLVYFVYSSFGQLRLMMELRRELSAVEQGIAAAQRRTEEIKAEIAYLRSDTYLEKIARQELGLVKPGEIIFMPESSLDAENLPH